MTQTMYGLIVAFIVATLFVLVGTHFISSGMTPYEASPNLTSTSRFSAVNETLTTADTVYGQLKDSPKDDSGSTNLLKNAPASVKQMGDLTLDQFDTAVEGATAFRVPGYIIAIFVTLFSILVLTLLIRTVISIMP